MFRIFSRHVVKWFFALAVLVAAGSAAQADFRICNATQGTVGVAIGYRATTGWVSEGWWQIKPAGCETLIEGALSSRFYYLYAEDASGNGLWNGTVNMCVRESKFKIHGVKNCFVRGFQKFGFQEIDTKSQTSWMVQLTEANASPGSSLNNPLVTGTVNP